MMEKDHPDQAIDTTVPDGETVNVVAWLSMRAAALEAEGDSE